MILTFSFTKIFISNQLLIKKHRTHKFVTLCWICYVSESSNSTHVTSIVSSNTLCDWSTFFANNSLTKSRWKFPKKKVAWNHLKNHRLSLIDRFIESLYFQYSYQFPISPRNLNCFEALKSQNRFRIEIWNDKIEFPTFIPRSITRFQLSTTNRIGKHDGKSQTVVITSALEIRPKRVKRSRTISNRKFLSRTTSTSKRAREKVGRRYSKPHVRKGCHILCPCTRNELLSRTCR